MRMSPAVPALLVAVVLTSAAGCSREDSSSSGARYDVKAGDDSCEVEESSIPAGKVTFDVENTGSDVTEVYVYGKDGDEYTKIMGERENIGPGTSQDFVVDLQPGEYQVACKPGMVGDGIRSDLTVTGDGAESEADDGEALYDRELEFEVGSDGTVESPEELTATAGEKIEFKLHNDSDEEHYLVVVDADGTEIGEAEAAGGGEAEFIAELPDSGTYTVKIYADGAEDDATTATLPVS